MPAVTGVDDAQDRLDELDRLNLFIIPLDHRRQWFRYHHLFADWLRLPGRDDPAPATAAPPTGSPTTTCPATPSATTSPLANPTAALSSSTASDGSSSDKAGRKPCGSGRSSFLETCSGDTPPHPRRRLDAHHAGRWDDVHELVEAFRDNETTLPAGIEGALVEAELPLLEAGRLVALGHTEDALRTAEAALDLVPGDEPRARTVCSSSSGAAGWPRANSTRLGSLPCRPRPRRQLRAVAIVHVIAGGHLAEIDRLEGHADDAEANSRAVLELAEHAGLADNPECTVALLTLGTRSSTAATSGGRSVHRSRHRTGRTAALRGP